MRAGVVDLRTVPIVLLPRGTSFAGAGTYSTIGVSLRPFRVVRLDLWRGTLLGTGSPTFTAFLEESSDGVSWHDLSGGGIDPDTGGDAATVEVGCRLFRARVVLTGTNPVVSCHIVGNVAMA